MPYIIETFDKPDHQWLRQQTRAQHLDFLAEHADLLLACGAKLDDEGKDLGGGLYVVALDSRQEAETLIAQDPYSKAGLFDKVLITRWRKAYVDGVCLLPGLGPAS